jgi:hypothetical protein
MGLLEDIMGLLDDIMGSLEDIMVGGIWNGCL